MFNDRRMASFPDIPDPRMKQSSRPEKICLISAVAVLFALLSFIWLTGLAVLYVRFWVYIAAVALIVLLLLGAGAFAIYHKVKNEKNQRRTAIVLSGLIVGIAVFMIIFITGFSTNRVPIEYSDSPNGKNQIVIMKSNKDVGVLIEAYPSFNRQFFIPLQGVDKVHSNGVIQGVEWEGDWLAKILLCDIDGNDTVITVDFSLIYDIPEGE